MCRNRNVQRALVLSMAILGAAVALQRLSAATITLSGSIASDDAVQLFDFTVATNTSVDLRSYGYAGGTVTNDAGTTVVAPGGFDTILTLFNGSGDLLAQNDEGAGVATDPTTGLAADARITSNLAAGTYILALTEFDNFAQGMNLADGFVETGNPNFTADPTFTSGGPCPNNLFRDISGTAGRCRDGDWTVNFANVAGVTPVAAVPEPGTSLLMALGVAALIWIGFRKMRGSCWYSLLLLVAMAGVSRADPDYTNVNDFLNGQRTLLAIDDFTVGPVLFETKSPTQIPDSNISTLPVYPQGPQLFARMFNLPYDVLIHVSSTTQMPVVVLDPNSKGSKSISGSGVWASGLAKARFSAAGFDDVVVLGAQTLQIVAAVDSQDFSKGIYAGPALNLDSPANLQTASHPQIAVGDFNGDGADEIAVVYSKLGIKSTQSLTVAVFKVDGNSLAITPAGSFDIVDGIPLSGRTFVSAIAAGKFGNPRHDQLAIAFYTTPYISPGGAVQMITFDLDTALRLTPVSTANAALDGSSSNAVHYPDLVLQKGHFDPQSGYDQAAMKFDKYLGIISFDPSLNIHLPTFLNTNLYCSSGLAVGGYARVEPDPQNPSNLQPSLLSQLAVTWEGGNVCTDAESLGIRIFNVNPPAAIGQDFVIDPNPVYSAEFTGPSLSQFYHFPIVAGDVQGRSLVLGEPLKVTLTNSIQPNAIIAAPPMHIDFVSPDPLQEPRTTDSPDCLQSVAGSSTTSGSRPAACAALQGLPPKVLNITGTPDGFYTKYSTEDSSNSSSTATSDNSWTFSAKEKAGISYEFGKVDEGAGLKLSAMASATQEQTHTYGHTWGVYADYKFGLTQQTGVDDQVWYTQSRFNIWIYPVIGQTVCPATKPNCAPDEMVPLHVQFSGPDQTQYGSTVGNLLPWYQPPWEPFNVLSYPGSYSQLLAIFPDMVKLSNDTRFYTDNSSLTINSTWSLGGSEQKSVGYDSTYAEDVDVSAVGAVGAGVGTLGGSLDVDLGGSDSFHELSQGTTAVSKSTGLTISKTSTFMDPFLYGYDVVPYIFGHSPSGGLVTYPFNVDIATSGDLQTAYVVDPVTNGGAWWTRAYGMKPDVALNHPSRWDLNVALQQNPLPDGCLAVGSGAEMDCATRSQYSPTNPWDSEFQSMRGFFISNFNSPGKGSLLEMAKPGTILWLQARVYNYSLKAMDRTTQVHVRFYAQPWDSVHKVPLKDTPSILVGEDVLPPIPPFSTDDRAPLNWTLAGVKFDTSNYDDQYFTFWVVVWMEDPDGNLVRDIDEHGLNAKPGTLTALTDVSEEKYGNNVGFFRMAFYVQPKVTTPGATQNGTLNLGKIDVPATTMRKGDHMIVSAMLSAEGGSAAGPSVLFYDGDPRSGGQIFGFDQASYVRPDGSYKISSSFKAKTCGMHQLFLVVNQGTPTEIIRRAPPVLVECP